MDNDYDMRPVAREAAALVDSLAQLLAGKPPNVQGAALADLVAIHIAGHAVRDDADATRELWAELLKLHSQTVAELIAPNAEIIHADADLRERILEAGKVS